MESAGRNRVRNFINNCLIVRVGGYQAVAVVGFGARAGGRVGQWCELVMVWMFIDVQCI